MNAVRMPGLALMLLLAGCVSAPAPISGKVAATRADELVQWQARGRMGITASEQSGSGAFNWSQEGVRSAVSLRGPAGFGALDLQMDEAGLQLRSSDGSIYDAVTALAALQVRLGVSLPVTALRYWLLGMPAPGEVRWLDESHQQLEQQGWRVTYQEWASRDRLRLPVRLLVEQDQVRIRIVVQNWTLLS